MDRHARPARAHRQHHVHSSGESYTIVEGELFYSTIEDGRRMAVAVYVSHNGQYFSYEQPDIDLENFRQWIESKTAIPIARQILMNGRGRNVKNLKNETEIFVYDKKTLTPGAQPPADRDGQLPNLRSPPTTPFNPETLESWQELFRQQRTWALEVVHAVRSGADSIEAVTFEADVISRSVAAALDNLNNYVDNLTKRFDATKQWATDYLQEQKDNLNDWESSREVLSELPIREDVGHVLRKAGTRHHHLNTLADLADAESLRLAETSLKVSSREFETQLDQLVTDVARLKADTKALDKHVTHVQDMDITALLEEAEAVAKRVSSDYEEVIKLGEEARSVNIASRKGASHTKELLPALEANIPEIQQAYAECLRTWNEAASGCFTALSEISGIQSKLSRLQSDVSGLEFKDEDSLRTVSQVFQLPIVYGSTLVEAVRRSEWTQRMQNDVDAMHGDLSQLTDKEQRRRKKWAAPFADFLNDDLNANEALIDLKASKPRNSWPYVDRNEIFAYLDDLRALKIDDAVQAITHKTKELDAPNRQRLKPFKNGSVQDLASSSVLKNGDDTRTLQDEKSRVEEKLKASESRVRKLEDVLHRQSQLDRASSGTFTPGGFSDYHRPSMSPIPFTKQSDFSSRPSISLRRASGASDDKAMVQRIVSLEAQIQKLQDEAHVERRSSTESRDKMQEAESVKRDLLANFEAQRQEFDDERQLMDDENHKLKIRIEELEDELDRLLGSREHTKITQDEQIKKLKHELEEEQDRGAKEADNAQLKHDGLLKDLSAQRDRAATLERQVNQHREERNNARDKNVDLAGQLRAHEEQLQDFVIALQNAHSNLSPAGSAPDEMKRLVNALEILSEGAAIHARGLDDSLQLATAEKKSLEERVETIEKEKNALQDRMDTGQGQIYFAEEMMKMARGNEAAAREDIKDIQNELNDLREKLAAGESGSGALRDKLFSEQEKNEELSKLKLENERTVQELRVETETATKESRDAVERVDKMRSKLASRGEKARQLSERLYQHNDRIVRMLEQFGYSITRQDDSLVIQRTSKLGSASAILSGGEELTSSTMKRTISGGVPTQHYSDPTDLETLYWTSDTESTDEDAKYRGFLSALQRIDLDSTMELIAKRYKDVENHAKRYQKESRAYRDKSHRFQAEAHDKIAYRSFKENDLALFLPTRNQATRPWAAFNIGAPHYFLREQDAHKLQARDWLLARITKVEERIVDLSRSMGGQGKLTDSIHVEASETASFEDENPFELSDGLRWYMIDAVEERPGAPGTPSVGKSTVIATTVEVKAQMGRKDKGSGGSVNAAQMTKHLNKSLESRRSSSASKRSSSIKKDSSSLKDAPAPLAPIASDADAQAEGSMVMPSEEDGKQLARADDRVFDVENVRSAVRAGESAAGPASRGPSRTTSPMKSKTTSPQKSATSPAKGKPWEKLFSMEYSG